MSARNAPVVRGVALATLVGLVLLSAIATSVGAEPATRATPDRPVDVNAADEARLQTVPGIGPALAKRIVEFRAQHGPFKNVDDLLKVRGIGEKSLAKLRPFLTVGKRG